MSFIPSPYEVEINHNEIRKRTHAELESRTKVAQLKCAAALKATVDRKPVIVDLSAEGFDDEHMQHVINKLNSAGWQASVGQPGHVRIVFPPLRRGPSLPLGNQRFG